MSITPLAVFDNKLLDGLEFCSRVYALFESIRSATDGPSHLRMRPSKVEKKLLEELLPICKYVQASYRPGRYISVRWIDGNQIYDAEILQHGAYVTNSYYPAKSHLEVTCTMHPKEHLMRQLLETKGGAFGLAGIRRLKSGEIVSTPVGYKNKEFIEAYSKLVLNEITKKAKKPYPENTTLIVQCTLNTIYMLDEWEALIADVREALPESSFREIYLYDTVCQYSHSFYPRRDA
jgi:hypothetical protein